MLSDNKQLLVWLTVLTSIFSRIFAAANDEDFNTPIYDAATYLRNQYGKAISAEWSIPKNFLEALPLKILAELSPSSPLSLIGCPYGTVPYNLAFCSEGIIAETPITGWCPNPLARFSNSMLSCGVLTTTEPQLLCPPGHRITLPPIDVIRGPCENDSVQKAVPTCDKPYEYSEEANSCIRRVYTAGFIGCRPGEVLTSNQTCLAAYQTQMQGSCSSGFNFTYGATGAPECTKVIVSQAPWNPYTQRPQCPEGYIPTTTLTRPREELPWNVDRVVPNPVTECTKMQALPAGDLRCPEGARTYEEHMYIYNNVPPVHTMPSIGNQLYSCVRLNEYPIVPSCSAPNEKALITGAKRMIEFLFSVAVNGSNRTSEKGANETQMPANSSDLNAAEDFAAGNKPRRLQADERYRINILTEKKYPPSVRSGLSDKSADPRFLKKRQVTQWPTGPIFTQTLPHYKEATSYATSDTSSTLPTPPKAGTPLENPPLDELVRPDILEAKLQKEKWFADSGLAVPWMELFNDGCISVVCESQVSAHFYLTCPADFQMRKDGSCKGNSYADYLLVCPEGYALDQKILAEGPYKRPHVVCTGQAPTETRYTCPAKVPVTNQTTSPLDQSVAFDDGWRIKGTANLENRTALGQNALHSAVGGYQAKIITQRYDGAYGRRNLAESVFLDVMETANFRRELTEGNNATENEPLYNENADDELQEDSQNLNALDKLVNEISARTSAHFPESDRLMSVFDIAVKNLYNGMETWLTEGAPPDGIRTLRDFQDRAFVLLILYAARNKTEDLDVQVPEDESGHRDSDPVPLERDNMFRDPEKIDPPGSIASSSKCLQQTARNSFNSNVQSADAAETAFDTSTLGSARRNAREQAAASRINEQSRSGDNECKHTGKSTTTGTLDFNRDPGIKKQLAFILNVLGWLKPVRPKPAVRIQDEHQKSCYDVELVPAWFSPKSEMIIALFGVDVGTTFLTRVEAGSLNGASPFYAALPKLNPAINAADEDFARQIQLYDDLMNTPWFGPPRFPSRNYRPKIKRAKDAH